MSNKELAMHVFCAVVYIVALWLLWGVNWRAAVGVLLFVWANNLIYSTRLKRTIRSGVWK